MDPGLTAETARPPRRWLINTLQGLGISFALTGSMFALQLTFVLGPFRPAMVVAPLTLAVAGGLLLARNFELRDRLSKQAALFKAVAEFTHGFTYYRDVGGRYLYVSPSVEALTGHPASAFYATPGFLTRVVHPEEQARWQNHVHQVDEHGVAERFVVRIVTATGQTRWLEHLCSPVYGEGGRQVGVRSTNIDVTDQQVDQQRRYAAEEAALSAARAKARLVSSMSHELRTPLNAILGFARLLDGDDLPPEKRWMPEAIIAGGEYLLGLSSQLLDLSALERGALQVTAGPVGAAALIAECLTLFGAQITGRGLTVVAAQLTPAEVTFLGHRQRVQQVLLNLMSNAAKYNRPQGAVQVRALVVGDRVRFAVDDTGEGIAPERQASVFEPFERLGRESSTIEGTGLGLSISRELVRLMGGEMGFRSTPGQGSTFWFELPRGPDLVEAAPQSAPRPPPARVHASCRRVLYVEDNAINRKLMRAFFERLGPELLEAETAEAALDALPGLDVDLVLMDLNLPGMSGGEALQAMRTRADIRQVPVIAVSADARPTTMAWGRIQGFHAYLTKPFRLDDLARHINSALEPRPGD